jgi:hypothetical protein
MGMGRVQTYISTIKTHRSLIYKKEQSITFLKAAAYNTIYSKESLTTWFLTRFSFCPTLCIHLLSRDFQAWFLTRFS